MNILTKLSTFLNGWDKAHAADVDNDKPQVLMTDRFTAMNIQQWLHPGDWTLYPIGGERLLYGRFGWEVHNEPRQIERALTMELSPDDLTFTKPFLMTMRWQRLRNGRVCYFDHPETDKVFL